MVIARSLSLHTYYPTGTRVPGKVPDRVPGNELPGNGNPTNNAQNYLQRIDNLLERGSEVVEL